MLDYYFKQSYKNKIIAKYDNVSYVSFYKEDGTLIEKKYLLKDIDNNDFIIPNETNYIYTAKDRTHFYKIKEISIID